MDTSMVWNIIVYGLLAWFLYTRFAPVKGLAHLNASDFYHQLQENKNKFLIDVREPHEFKSGSIPGSVNIPLSQLKQRVNEVPNNKDIYLYCRSGMRSKQAAKILKKSGISKLAHLRGGILAWDGKTTKK